MTKEEELKLLEQIHEQEKDICIQAWTIPEVLSHCESIMDSRRRIRMGELEEYLKKLAKQQHPIAAELYAKHQQLEKLRHLIVKHAKHIIPKVLELIIDDAPIALLFEELLDISEYALYRSTRIFDHARGLAYRTYARWTIRAFCSLYIDHKIDGKEWFPNEPVGRIISVPV